MYPAPSGPVSPAPQGCQWSGPPKPRESTYNADGGADRLSRERLRQQDMGARGCGMTPLTPHWGGGRSTCDTCQPALDEVSVVLGAGAAPAVCTPPSGSLRGSPPACGCKTCDLSSALSCCCFLEKTGGLSCTLRRPCPAAGRSLPSSGGPHPPSHTL